MGTEMGICCCCWVCLEPAAGDSLGWAAGDARTGAGEALAGAGELVLELGRLFQNGVLLST